MWKRIESGISARSVEFDFLSWVKGYAANLGLMGATFMKKDGSIEIIAEGEEKNLTKLAKKLEKGDLFSRVENFYVKWMEPKKEFDNFSVMTEEQYHDSLVSGEEKL